MEHAITRGQIETILRQWQDGALTAEQVHEWAQAMYFPGALEIADEEPDGNSASNEVLQYLDCLDSNLIIVEDVPIYLEFLATPSGQFDNGYRKFVQALDRIDMLSRRQALSRIPLYAPFCKELN